MGLENSDERIECITLDVSEIDDINEFHLLLKNELSLPFFYVPNWNNFALMIDGVVELPHSFELVGWNEFENKFKDDAKQFKDILDAYNEKNALWGCRLIYK